MNEYDFDTVDGNHLCSGFLDAYDEFRVQLLLKKEYGKLDQVIRKEQREQRKRENEQNRGRKAE